MAAKLIRQSASCILINRLPSGELCRRETFDYRILFVKRHQKMKSWPGALVFPGGNIEKAEMGPNFSALSSLPPRSPSGPCEREEVYRRCALRELEEETGYRNSSVTTSHLIPWSFWQTPLVYPVRFNAPMFLLFTPSMAPLTPQEGEIECLQWLSPAELFSNPKLMMAPPQVIDSLKFFPHRRFEALVSFAEDRYANHPTRQCTPVLVQFRDGIAALLPDDSFYGEASDRQLEDLSKTLTLGCDMSENEEVQEVMMRSVVSKEGRRFKGSGQWDGHPMASVGLDNVQIREME